MPSGVLNIVLVSICTFLSLIASPFPLELEGTGIVGSLLLRDGKSTFLGDRKWASQAKNRTWVVPGLGGGGLVNQTTGSEIFWMPGHCLLSPSKLLFRIVHI